MVSSKLSPINVKEPHSTGDGVIPPLNPPNRRVGPRFKVPHLWNMSDGPMGQHKSIKVKLSFTITRRGRMLGNGKLNVV